MCRGQHIVPGYKPWIGFLGPEDLSMKAMWYKEDECRRLVVALYTDWLNCYLDLRLANPENKRPGMLVQWARREAREAEQRAREARDAEARAAEECEPTADVAPEPTGGVWAPHTPTSEPRNVEVEAVNQLALLEAEHAEVDDMFAEDEPEGLDALHGWPAPQLPAAEDVAWLRPEPEPAHSPTEIPSSSSEEED